MYQEVPVHSLTDAYLKKNYNGSAGYLFLLHHLFFHTQFFFVPGLFVQQNQQNRCTRRRIGSFSLSQRKISGSSWYATFTDSSISPHLFPYLFWVCFSFRLIFVYIYSSGGSKPNDWEAEQRWQTSHNRVSRRRNTCELERETFRKMTASKSPPLSFSYVLINTI